MADAPRPLSPDARAGIIDDIRTYMRDLLTDYRPHGGPGPKRGLLAQLDALGSRLVLASSGATEGKAGKPGSRQPPSVHVDHAARIRRDAVIWDRVLRDSDVAQSPAQALHALALNADSGTDDMLRDLVKDVKMWHATAAIICGHVDAERDLPRHYPQAQCMECDGYDIYGKASDMVGECRACGATYSKTRLLNLIRDAV